MQGVFTRARHMITRGIASLGTPEYAKLERHRPKKNIKDIAPLFIYKYYKKRRLHE